MNELQTNNFDYSLLDTETADFLKDREISMKQTLEKTAQSLGEDLSKARDKLSNHYKGTFEKWYTALGFKKQSVYNYINRYEYVVQQLDNQSDIEKFQELPVRLQNEMSKKTAKNEVNQAVFDGDITTHKEYKEMEKRLKKAEQAKQQAEKQAEQAQKSEEIALRKLEEVEKKEPEVITQEVIKEVIPEHIKKQIQEKDKVLQSAKEEMESMQSEIDKLERLTTGMDEEAKKEKEIKLLMLDASKSVLKTKIKIDEFLQEVAVTPYRRGAIAASSQAAKDKLAEGVEELKKFIEEMELSLNATIEHH